MQAKRSSILLSAAAGLAMLALTAGPVRAEPSACGPDSERLCSNVKEGGGARIQCLFEHQAQLSPACREQVEHMQAHAQEVSNACSDDAARLCKGVEAGKGRVVQCLAEHEAQLTPDCRADVSQAKGKVEGAKENAKVKMEDKKEDFEQACAPDISRDCSGVEPGHGNLVHCLHQHEATLSPSCRAVLK